MKNVCFLAASLLFLTLTSFSQSNNYSFECDSSVYRPVWHFIGPENQVQQTSGKVHALWINPANQDQVLAGTESGLWKTSDGGHNWINLTDCCLSGTGISCIAVQPGDTNIIYIGSGVGNNVKSTDHNYGYGIFKSTDGGISWQNLEVDNSLFPKENFCSKIMVHPVLFTNVYAIIGSRAYKSVNSGKTWKIIFGEAENPDKLILRDIELNPRVTDYDEVYISSCTHIIDWNNCDTALPCNYYCAGKIKFATAKVWKINSKLNSPSARVGTLEDMCGTIPGYQNDTRIAMLSFTLNSLNIACQTESGKVMIFRKKGEEDWTNTSPHNTMGFNSVYSFPFAVSSANDSILYLGGFQLFKSTDGGKTLSPLWGYWAWLRDPKYAGSHADVRDFVLYRANPSGDDVIFLGTDGGVGKTNDGGKTTLNLNSAGLQITQIQGISNSEKFPGLIYAGSQDNGMFSNIGNTWKCNVMGDAYDCVSDLEDSLVAYTTSNSSTIFKTISGGDKWFGIGCPKGENCMDKPLWIDNQDKLYVGAKNLWRLDGKEWTQLTNISTNASIRSFKMTEDGNTAFLAYSGELWDGVSPVCDLKGRVYKVTNISTSPEVADITGCLEGVRWTSITDIAIEPLSGDKIWVTFGGFWKSDYKVFRFENNSWQEYGQGLPDIPANSVKYLKNSDDLLFIGTDDGVYYRTGHMLGWKRFGCKLPWTIVSDLEINYRSGVIRAATYGRGIWESRLPGRK